MGFWNRFFGQEKSSAKAKERLQLVLIHDRNDISADMLERLRADLIEVIQNYLEIDAEHIELQLEREECSVALVANIPVKTVRRAPRAQKGRLVS